MEALRVAARKQPALFRRILGFARERFETDKASYQISADLARMPAPNSLPDEALEPLLDDVHGRQVLHVTFGSVLSGRGSDGAWLFRDALLGCLLDHEDEHYAVLASHLGRHLRPFVR